MTRIVCAAAAGLVGASLLIRPPSDVAGANGTSLVLGAEPWAWVFLALSVLSLTAFGVVRIAPWVAVGGTVVYFSYGAAYAVASITGTTGWQVPALCLLAGSFELHVARKWKWH